MLVGVDHDQPIEDYWSKARLAEFVEYVRSLKPALVTSPNFSVFRNVPRWDNLHNMKRIAICWHELAAAGITTALHVNARTDHDYRRWGEFLRCHPEIQAVSFEFDTPSPNRAIWHADRLIELAAGVPQALRIVVRGGRRLVPRLGRAFDSLTYIATDPYMRTTKRRRLQWVPGKKAQWQRFPRKGLDRLLQHNVDHYIRMLSCEWN